MTTALTLKKIDDSFKIVRDPGAIEIMNETVEALGLDAVKLDRINVPLGGVTGWTVPGPAGDQLTNEIHAIVFHVQGRQKRWYRAAYEESGGGSASDCYSVDGTRGFGNNEVDPKDPTASSWHECSECAWSKYGTRRRLSGKGSGAGKDCGDYASVFLFTPQSALPIELSIPGTSIRAWAAYQTRLVGAGMRPWQAITSLKLEKTRTPGGFDVAVLVPTMVRELKEDEVASIASSVEGMIALAKQLSGRAPE